MLAVPRALSLLRAFSFLPARAVAVLPAHSLNPARVEALMGHRHFRKDEAGDSGVRRRQTREPSTRCLKKTFAPRKVRARS